MPASFVMIGCSHHDAAVEFRERISSTPEETEALLRSFSRQHESTEAVMLSTCNRVEFYVASSSDQNVSAEQLVRFLADHHGEDVAEVNRHMIRRSDSEVAEHLFLVAASLDSMVVGEAQILSQVKQAYESANQVGVTGPLTHGIFQAANRTAKRVQTETSIHRRRLSVPSVAVGEVASEVFDTLRGKHVVICGAGEMAEETLRYLKTAGADDLVIVNRGYERAVKLATEFGGQALPMEELETEVMRADLLVGTTSSPTPLMTSEQFGVLHTQRGERLQLILDLAVPRDFDPAIGNQPGVYLYQIDDLKLVCDRNRREREKQWPKAKKIIDEEVNAFVSELGRRRTGPVIRQLREQAEQIKQTELERLMGKLNGAAGEATEREIEKAFDRLTNKLLHPPLASLRDDAAKGHSRGLLEALRQLFQLGDDV
ncbi:MAG: glutamyl-tRNA reductase [Planctomycetota bacterium]